MEQRGDGFTEMGDRYANFTVYDQHYEKVGKVDDLFVDENDQPEYIGVKMGLFGLRSTLIPFSLVTVDEERQLIEVATDKDTINNAPNFDDDTDITPEFEEQVYSHYGLQQTSTGGTGSYGGYHSEGTETTGATGAATGATADVYDRDDRDELRVQRSEEELRAGTREREAGQVNVRKRVRTDRERIEVPVKREEVSVERVPVNEEAPSGAVIGEDEVVVPVIEEEVIVDKRAVVKEEVRVRKAVVRDTEVVEEDVRREEIDVEDATTRRTDTDAGV